jgi:predicted DNA-binding transcriptional regulator AlpA
MLFIDFCQKGAGGTAVPRNKVSTLTDNPQNYLAQIIKLEQRITPRGLSRVEAAIYIGISPSLFDQMVKDGRMPAPKAINGRVVWDRYRLDEAFEALPDKGDRNPWDEDQDAS